MKKVATNRSIHNYLPWIFQDLSEDVSAWRGSPRPGMIEAQPS